MDDQNNFDYPYKGTRSEGLATASLVMGILSLTTTCCLYAALPFGALAIIFALLSRGGEMRLDGKGTAGLALGIIGLVITVVIFILMFIYTIYYYGGFEEFMEYSNQLTEQYMQYYNMQ